MEPDALYLLIVASLAVPISWVLPARFAPDGVAFWTIATLAFLSPLAAAWLAFSSAGTLAALSAYAHNNRRKWIVILWGAALLAGLFVPRELPAISMVGSAYFTLRNLHVLLDGYMHRETPTTLRNMFRYQFFAPVLLVGPIHRYPNFARSLARRRFDIPDLATGAERALLGLALASVVGSHYMGRALYLYAKGTPDAPDFLHEWGKSGLEWIQLYFIFAGLSSVAVGLSRMMGIAIEENFDRPYRAKSLLDFWTRWHISLSLWCRDYVFQTVTAATRQPIIGLIAAMAAIGVWHQTSVFYLLWALWQVIGIVLNRLLISMFLRRGWHLHPALTSVITPIAVLGWLSLARPTVNALLDLAQ